MVDELLRRCDQVDDGRASSSTRRAVSLRRAILNTERRREQHDCEAHADSLTPQAFHAGDLRRMPHCTQDRAPKEFFDSNAIPIGM
jgi:hypothetical protein